MGACDAGAKDKNMIDSILTFFRRKQHGDMLFFKHDGFWTHPITVAPHDPNNAPSISEMFVRIGADGLRHAEHIRLRSQMAVYDAVLITDLPLWRQTLVMMDSGEELPMKSRMTTESLSAIEGSLRVITESKAATTSL